MKGVSPPIEPTMGSWGSEGGIAFLLEILLRPQGTRRVLIPSSIHPGPPSLARGPPLRDNSALPERCAATRRVSRKPEVPGPTLHAGSTHPRHAPTCPQRRHRLGATVHTPTCPQRRHRLDVANWHQRCRSHGHELGLFAKGRPHLLRLGHRHALGSTVTRSTVPSHGR